MKLIANSGLQRKLWLIRKLYAGNGGIIPPNDPRIMALTDEEIDLDLTHYMLDNPDKFAEVFTDSAFGDYEKALEEEHSTSEVKDKEIPEVNPPVDWEDIPESELDGK